MYVPAEDTLFLLQYAKTYRGIWALEIGTGSGTIAQALNANFRNVVATDIDLGSLEYCRRKGGMMLVCCDAASALYGKFDLVVTNPPYLPGNPEDDAAVHGGPTGIETTMHFIESALPVLSDKGRILVVVSSLADMDTLDKFFQKKNLKKRVVGKKILFYERLYAIELTF